MSRCEDFPSVSFKPLRKPFKSYFKSFAHIADTLNEKHIIEPPDLHCYVLWRMVYIWCTRMLYWNALKDWRADPESTSIKSVCSAWLSAAHLTYLLNSQIEFELGPFKVHERVHCNSPGFGIRVVNIAFPLGKVPKKSAVPQTRFASKKHFWWPTLINRFSEVFGNTCLPALSWASVPWTGHSMWAAGSWLAGLGSLNCLCWWFWKGPSTGTDCAREHSQQWSEANSPMQ